MTTQRPEHERNGNELGTVKHPRSGERYAVAMFEGRIIAAYGSLNFFGHLDADEIADIFDEWAGHDDPETMGADGRWLEAEFGDQAIPFTPARDLS